MQCSDSHIRGTTNGLSSAVAQEYFTDDTNLEKAALIIEQKTRKVEDVYSSERWKDENEYRVLKLHKVIRNHIFIHFNFCKWEGARMISIL